MFHLTGAVRRIPGPTRLAAGALFVALAASTLFWVGRVSATASESAPTAVSKSVSNVPTGKADAVDAVVEACTVSNQYNDMPIMSKTFKLGGNAKRSVIVLFQGEWSLPTAGVYVAIQLTIDGVVLEGSSFAIVDRPVGEPNTIETHGVNFISDPLAPGKHTATMQWADNGVGQGCVFARSLIVMHQ